MTRMLDVLSVILLFAACVHSAPATRPATLPGGAVTVLNGAVWFMPPADWKLTEKADTGRSFTYMSADGEGTLTVAINPNPLALPTTPQSRARMADPMIKAIATRLAQIKAEVLVPPRVEEDKEFGLRIHDAFKAAGQTIDQVHLYHAVGPNLALVTATATTDSADRTAAIHKMGADVMRTVRLTAPSTGPAIQGGLADKPTLFAKARLRLQPPAGWKAQTIDQVNGTIATWRDPLHASRLISADAHALPPEARDEPALRQKLIDQLVTGRTTAFKLEGATLTGQPEKIADDRFLRKMRTLYDTKDVRFEVTTRHVLVGETVLCITTLGTAADAAMLMDLADRIAASASPPGKP